MTSSGWSCDKLRVSCDKLWVSCDKLGWRTDKLMLRRVKLKSDPHHQQQYKDNFKDRVKLMGSNISCLLLIIDCGAI